MECLFDICYRKNMNQFLLTGLLSFGLFSLCAQDFYWGAYLYPNYSDRRLIAIGTNLSEQMLQEIEDRETGKFSLSGGGHLGWRGERAGFQIGLGFAETGYRTVREPIPPDNPDAVEASQQQFIYRNYNLELPLEIHFVHELDYQNFFYFMLGGVGSYNLANREVKILYDGDLSERRDAPPPEEPYRRTNFAFQAGLGWERNLGGTTNLYLQPNFQFWLSGLLRDAPINRSLYNLGLIVGLKFYRE